MSRAIHSTYGWLLLFLGALVFVWGVGPWIDKQFPVVNPFVVTGSGLESGGVVVVEGWMDRRRATCRTIEVYALVWSDEDLPSIADIVFTERRADRIVSRPPGPQRWGPWRIAVPERTRLVEVVTRHACHPLWDTVSRTPVYWRGQPTDKGVAK